jgi:hypothetical protein
MHTVKHLAMLAFALAFSADAVHGQQADAVTLFNNVRIFDGKNATLSAPSNVLIRGNLIERISQTPIAVDRSATPGSSTAAAGR